MIKRKEKTIRTIVLPPGIVAGLIHRRWGTYTRCKNSRVNNPQTGNQQANRYAFKKVNDLWSALKEVCHNTYENVDSLHSPYREFMKISAELGQCEGIPPAWISRGSFPPISYEWKDNRIVTDIKLGDLEITEATSVGEFSRAVVANNSGYDYGDELVFLQVDGASEMRRDKGKSKQQHEHIFVSAEDFRVRLDAIDNSKILAVSAGKFNNYEGCVSTPILPFGEDREGKISAFAFYHARRRGYYNQTFSSQQLLSIKC